MKKILEVVGISMLMLGVGYSIGHRNHYVEGCTNGIMFATTRIAENLRLSFDPKDPENTKGAKMVCEELYEHQ